MERCCSITCSSRTCTGYCSSKRSGARRESRAADVFPGASSAEFPSNRGGCVADPTLSTALWRRPAFRDNRFRCPARLRYAVEVRRDHKADAMWVFKPSLETEAFNCWQRCDHEEVGRPYARQWCESLRTLDLRLVAARAERDDLNLVLWIALNGIHIPTEVCKRLAYDMDLSKRADVRRQRFKGQVIACQMKPAV
mgnify:CR=1 FL=1